MHGDGGFSFNPQYEKDTIYAWTPIKRKPGTELSPTEKMFNYSVCAVYFFVFFGLSFSFFSSFFFTHCHHLAQLSQHRVVVENAIRRLKTWAILRSKYRHYTMKHDVQDRAQLGMVVRTVAALCNWLDYGGHGGKPRRTLDSWKPRHKPEYSRKLYHEAQRLGGEEAQRMDDFLEGRKTLRELGLEPPGLTVEQERLLQEKGDKQSTWKLIDQLEHGTVVLQPDTGVMRMVDVDSSIALAAAAASSKGAAPATSR
jgi:hypothetical protein